MKFRTIENPTGTGYVYDGEKSVADVMYSVQVRKRIIQVRTFTGLHESEGLIEINGTVIVLDGQQNLADSKAFQLHLEDGRRLDFYATRGDLISGKFSISPAGGRGLYTAEGVKAA